MISSIINNARLYDLLCILPIFFTPLRKSRAFILFFPANCTSSSCSHPSDVATSSSLPSTVISPGAAFPLSSLVFVVAYIFSTVCLPSSSSRVFPCAVRRFRRWCAAWSRSSPRAFARWCARRLGAKMLLFRPDFPPFPALSPCDRRSFLCPALPFKHKILWNILRLSRWKENMRKMKVKIKKTLAIFWKRC